jgi:hypothetical protein
MTNTFPVLPSSGLKRLLNRLFLKANPPQNVDECRYLSGQHKRSAQQTGINAQMLSQPTSNSGDPPIISGAVQLLVFDIRCSVSFAISVLGGCDGRPTMRITRDVA